MRVALVHDWLTGMRGGERCLEAFANLLPGAPILTLFHEPGSVSEAIESHPIIASPFSRLSTLRKRYRKLLPLFPWAMEQLPGADYDVLFSLSHCAAKAIEKRPGARHICYCFTPARYLWDHAETYFDRSRSSLAVRVAAGAFLPDLRQWDLATAAGVDRFIAISHFVAERIRRIYERDAEVIYPPVETRRFSIAPPEDVGERYLMVTALAPYKGVDLAIRAFNRWGRELVIIGRGEDEKRLRSLAKPNIRFLGWLPDEDVATHYSHCRAFLLPCVEDFGITPLEAMASGRPVVAFGHGGATETVLGDGDVTASTGAFFHEMQEESLIAALEEVERNLDHFDPVRLRQRAAQFDLSVYEEALRELFAGEGVLVS